MLNLPFTLMPLGSAIASLGTPLSKHAFTAVSAIYLSDNHNIDAGCTSLDAYLRAEPTKISIVGK